MIAKRAHHEMPSRRVRRSSPSRARKESEVRAVLARLPRHASTVLVLRHSGLSYAEIAEAMEVRVGQVGTMLRRAEARFRKEVDRATRS